MVFLYLYWPICPIWFILLIRPFGFVKLKITSIDIFITSFRETSIVRHVLFAGCDDHYQHRAACFGSTSCRRSFQSSQNQESTTQGWRLDNFACFSTLFKETRQQHANNHRLLLLQTVLDVSTPLSTLARGKSSLHWRLKQRFYISRYAFTLLLNIKPLIKSQFIYADMILDHLTYGLIKISAVLFYKRIFTIASFRRVANIALIIIACWTIAAVLVCRPLLFEGLWLILLQSAMFLAWPISNFWNQAGNTNLDLGAWVIAMAASDVALDLTTLCLPLPIIRSLQISTRRKISLLGIFWLGFL